MMMSENVSAIPPSLDCVIDHAISLPKTSAPTTLASLSGSDESSVTTELHKLTGKWDMYYHLPHNTSWDLASYKKIFSGINLAEQAILLNDAVPEIIIKSCMLFVMREGITPLWEDPKNRNGGCFSFKISNNSVCNVWKNVFYSLLGGTLFKDRS